MSIPYTIGAVHDKCSLSHAMARGYHIALGEDGCAEVTTPEGQTYFIYHFACDCPDKMLRGGAHSPSKRDGYNLSDDFVATKEEDGDLRDNSDRQRNNLFACLSYKPSDQALYGLTFNYIQGGVSEILTQCHIDHLSDHSPHKLSYGQKHLVALASVLALSPELVLMDDPFAGLDQHCRQAVLNVLQRRRQNAHLTVVWTTHGPNQIPHGADAQLYVHGGRIVAQ